MQWVHELFEKYPELAVFLSVGPQFVHGLKKDGLPQVLFAVIVCVTGLAAELCRPEQK